MLARGFWALDGSDRLRDPSAPLKDVFVRGALIFHVADYPGTQEPFCGLSCRGINGACPFCMVVGETCMICLLHPVKGGTTYWPGAAAYLPEENTVRQEAAAAFPYILNHATLPERRTHQDYLDYGQDIEGNCI